MGKKILYTDLTDANSLIEDMLNSPQMQKALKRKNLFDMWKKSVDKIFYDKSKPYSLMGRTLVIACKNAATAQELQLRKVQIFNKLEPYLKALNLSVEDIKFDTKRWSDDT